MEELSSVALGNASTSSCSWVGRERPKRCPGMAMLRELRRPCRGQVEACLIDRRLVTDRIPHRQCLQELNTVYQSVLVAHVGSSHNLGLPSTTCRLVGCLRSVRPVAADTTSSTAISSTGCPVSDARRHLSSSASSFPDPSRSYSSKQAWNAASFVNTAAVYQYTPPVEFSRSHSTNSCWYCQRCVTLLLSYLDVSEVLIVLLPHGQRPFQLLYVEQPITAVALRPGVCLRQHKVHLLCRSLPQRGLSERDLCSGVTCSTPPLTHLLACHIHSAAPLAGFCPTVESCESNDSEGLVDRASYVVFGCTFPVFSTSYFSRIFVIYRYTPLEHVRCANDGLPAHRLEYILIFVSFSVAFLI